MSQEALFPMPQEARTSDDYWTSKWIFDALGVEFDLDVACPPDGPLHTPAKAWYTQETNGLASPWFGNVWMNPPFSETTPWVYKWLNHGNGIALLPFAKSKWFAEVWDNADAIMPIIRPKRPFVQGEIYTAVFLASLGEINSGALHRSGIGRVR